MHTCQIPELGIPFWVFQSRRKYRHVFFLSLVFMLFLLAEFPSSWAFFLCNAEHLLPAYWRYLCYLVFLLCSQLQGVEYLQLCLAWMFFPSPWIQWVDHLLSTSSPTLLQFFSYFGQRILCQVWPRHVYGMGWMVPIQALPKELGFMSMHHPMGQEDQLDCHGISPTPNYPCLGIPALSSSVL